jgi:hypothetical protein
MPGVAGCDARAARDQPGDLALDLRSDPLKMSPEPSWRLPVALRPQSFRVAEDEGRASASIGRRISIGVTPATAIAILRDDRNRPLLRFKFAPMKGGNGQQAAALRRLDERVKFDPERT